jgi:hypothetical protein
MVAKPLCKIVVYDAVQMEGFVGIVPWPGVCMQKVKRFGTIAPSDETSPANQEEAMAA